MSNCKRVALVVATKSLNVSSGITTFIRALAATIYAKGDRVDIICDYTPKDGRLIEGYENYRVFVPDNEISYKGHKNVHTFTESLCIERILNFKNSLLKATKECFYDMIIVNDDEGIEAALALNLNIPVYYYTHQPGLFDPKFQSVYSNGYMSWVNALLKIKEIKTLVASYDNQDILKAKGIESSYLPLALSPDLLEANKYPAKKGLLFIGNNSERKDPAEYIRVVKELGCYAYIMTYKNKISKWEQDLAEAGITNYELVCNLRGKEKVDFISKAKAAYHPAKSETFGYAVIEEACSCPTFVLAEYEWTAMHKDWANIVSRDKVVDEIRKALESTEPYSHSVQKYIDEVDDALDKLMVCHASNREAPDSIKELKEPAFLSEILKDKGYGFLRTLQNNIGKYKVYHTRTSSIIYGKDYLYEEPPEPAAGSTNLLDFVKD